MSIKPFQKKDLGHFLPNEWSDPDNCLDQLFDPAYVTMTLWNEDGMVAAILCFRCYWGKNWDGFFLIAEHFEPHLAIVLKEFIESTMERLDADRLQTCSVACKKLDKWHEFLGFKLEGMRQKMLYGKDYNMWARMRGGK